jgi:hypothetical protein
VIMNGNITAGNSGNGSGIGSGSNSENGISAVRLLSFQEL